MTCHFFFDSCHFLKNIITFENDIDDFLKLMVFSEILSPNTRR